jgi:hypothetical protein
MASVNDVFTVFLFVVGAGGASSGTLYWLLNQSVFDEATPHLSPRLRRNSTATKVTLKEKIFKLSADDKAAFLLVFSELKHTYFCKLQFQPLPFQFPFPQKEWLLILKNPVAYATKASPLQRQLIEHLKETLQEDLDLHQQLAKQILSTAKTTGSVGNDYELQTLILKRTVLWQLALELCLVTLNSPKKQQHWQPLKPAGSQSLALKAQALGTPEGSLVEGYWQALELAKPRLSKMLAQHFKETDFAKRYHYQTFAPLFPADSDTLIRYALNTPSFV